MNEKMKKEVKLTEVLMERFKFHLTSRFVTNHLFASLGSLDDKFPKNIYGMIITSYLVS